MFLNLRTGLVAAMCVATNLISMAGADDVLEVTPVRKSLQGEKADPIHLRFALSGDTTKPASEVKLTITARVSGDYHVFALDQDPNMVGLPTTIELGKIVGLEAIAADFEPDRAADIEQPFGDIVQRVHHSEITWTRLFKTSASISAGDLPGVSGTISYQLCGNGNCRPKLAVPFALGSVVAASSAPVVDAACPEI